MESLFLLSVILGALALLFGIGALFADLIAPYLRRKRSMATYNETVDRR